ncbi:MAG: glucosiduronase, partial [Acidobacteriota bacterium]|nr:glucosiduronase [Acidobacteriota bacterium]
MTRRSSLLDRRNRLRYAAVLLVVAAISASAETGRDAWLRYGRLDHPPMLPAVLVNEAGTSPLVESAQAELLKGVKGMTGHTLRLESAIPKEPALVLKVDASLGPDSYSLQGTAITAGDDRGLLYGTFAFLRKIGMGEATATFHEKQAPAAPVRWINQWDNLDGSIERGYGGRSIFWENGRVRNDMTRVSEYGRLLASLGIDGTTIDNVNADKRLLSDDYIPQVAKIAAAFRPWGVRIALSVDFGSPQSLGGLDTFDPLDPKVAAWWKERVDQFYDAIPDLAGIVLKADSEGRVGP